jgi:hypothetical protein
VAVVVRGAGDDSVVAEVAATAGFDAVAFSADFFLFEGVGMVELQNIDRGGC